MSMLKVIFVLWIRLVVFIRNARRVIPHAVPIATRDLFTKLNFFTS